MIIIYINYYIIFNIKFDIGINYFYEIYFIKILYIIKLLNLNYFYFIYFCCITLKKNYSLLYYIYTSSCSFSFYLSFNIFWILFCKLEKSNNKLQLSLNKIYNNCKYLLKLYKPSLFFSFAFSEGILKIPGKMLNPNGYSIDIP